MKKKVIFRTQKIKWKTPIVTSEGDVLKFGILCPPKKEIEKKRKILYEIYKRYTIIGLQDFHNYKNLNPVEVSLYSNSLMNKLFEYKKYKNRFIIRNL